MKELVLVLVLVLLLGSFIYASRVMPEVPSSEKKASESLKQFRESVSNTTSKVIASRNGYLGIASVVRDCGVNGVC